MEGSRTSLNGSLDGWDGEESIEVSLRFGGRLLRVESLRGCRLGVFAGAVALFS